MIKRNLLYNRLKLGIILVSLFSLFRIIYYYQSFLKREVYLWGDEAIYAMLSQRFLSGDFTHAFHPYWNAGFPIATIPFYLITHSWESAQTFLSMTASVLLIFVLYFTLRKISEGLGIITAFLVALSPALAKLTLSGGWTEPLYIFLLWIAVYFGWKLIQTERKSDYFFCGIFFGLAYFVRTEASYTLLALLLFLFLSILFERRKQLKILNSLVLLAGGLALVGYMVWILSSSKFFTKSTVNFYPTASFIAFFCLNAAIAIFGLFFNVKDRLNYLKVFKKVFPKIMLLFIAFFIVNLFYISVISVNMGRFIVSGKYSFINSGHPFSPERDRLTTFAQDIWSIDYPNYSSPYYDSAKIYKKFLKNIDTSWEFFPKNLGTLLNRYGFDNIFSLFETKLIMLGIVAGLLQKRFLKFTTFLLTLWFITLLWVTMFMGPYQRYLAYSYPFAIVAIGIASFSVSSLLGKFNKSLFIVSTVVIFLVYFNVHFNLSDFLKGEGTGGNLHQKIIGDYLKSQNIKVVMARTEGISFYSGAKLVYIPSAPPDVIVEFAKKWGVEYIVSRPEESSWPYMKAMADPNFKQKDLILVKQFDDKTLVWKVPLTEEEKSSNYRTGKKVELFCDFEGSSGSLKLESCPDRTY